MLSPGLGSSEAERRVASIEPSSSNVSVTVRGQVDHYERWVNRHARGYLGRRFAPRVVAGARRVDVQQCESGAY
jgi:hypothetical protein